MIQKCLPMILILSLSLCLYACGNGEKYGETSMITTVETTMEAPVSNPTYTVTVKDENGSPVSGLSLRLKSDTNTYPGMTNDLGMAVFSVKRNEYQVTITSQLTGYEYPTEQTAFSFADGVYELTITLHRVSE